MIRINYDYFLHFPFGLIPKYYSLTDILIDILNIKDSDPIINQSFNNIVEYITDTLRINLIILDEKYINKIVIDYNYNVQYKSLQYKLSIGNIKRNIAKQKSDYGLITVLTKKRVPNFITAYTTELNEYNDNLQSFESDLITIPLVSKVKSIMKLIPQNNSNRFILENKFVINNNKTLLLFLHKGELNNNPTFQIYHNKIVEDNDLPVVLKYINNITPINSQVYTDKSIENYNRNKINNMETVKYSIIETSIYKTNFVYKLLFLTSTNIKNKILISAILGNNDINDVIKYIKLIKDENEDKLKYTDTEITKDIDKLTSLFNIYNKDIDLSDRLSRFKSINKILKIAFNKYKSTNKIFNNIVDEFILFITLEIYKKIEPLRITKLENFILAVLYLYNESTDQIYKYYNIMNYKLDLLQYNIYKTALQDTITKLKKR